MKDKNGHPVKVGDMIRIARDFQYPTIEKVAVDENGELVAKPSNEILKDLFFKLYNNQCCSACNHEWNGNEYTPCPGCGDTECMTNLPPCEPKQVAPFIDEMDKYHPDEGSVPSLAVERDEQFSPVSTELPEHTGNSVSYYDVTISEWTNPDHQQDKQVTISCNDIIEALKMNYACANVFKAIWRICAAKMGKCKKGNNTKYDAEKSVFFSERVLKQESDK